MATRKKKTTAVATRSTGTAVATSDWEERLAAEAKAESAVERPSTSRISFRAGVMSYMGDEVPGNQMDVVVLCSYVENTFYGDREFDADNPQPPVCYALGEVGSEGSMGPDDNTPPDQQQSELCVSCAQFKWGSGRGRGKACGSRRRLVVIPANALKNTDELKNTEMALMVIAVTSVKRWAKYVNTIGAVFNRPAWAMITRVSVKPDVNTQFKVLFEPIEPIPGEVLEVLEPLKTAALDVARTPIDMSGNTEEEEEEEKPRRSTRKKY